MRLWFTAKKEKLTGWLFKTYLFSLVFFWLMMRDDFKISATVATVLFVIGWMATKKGFKKRGQGLRVEDNSAQWLKDELSKSGIDVRLSVKMRYGDIDIYIPSKKMVIDVKAYHRIDGRIKTQGALRSIHFQLSYVNAQTAVFWLPNAHGKEVVEIEPRAYVVCGKKALLRFIEEH